MAGKVAARAYLSPTLVLLAFDWPGGAGRDDFLGFAIRREPGFKRAARSWLPNRLTFDGPAADLDSPSNESPIQKFMWWDARIDDKDRGKSFTYTIIPMVGQAGALTLLTDQSNVLKVTLPNVVVGRIGTYFNRAVVSSQAFVKEFGRRPTGAKLNDALAWLANGLEDAVPEFLATADAIDGAIYHLTDEQWVIPAFGKRTAATDVVYDNTAKAHATNAKAVQKLAAQVTFHPRKRTRIMHDKFLVRARGATAKTVLAGSANFTTEGLTTQANVLHTFRSPELAALYREREQFLQNDPTAPDTVKRGKWSKQITIDGAKVRVFFPPETKDSRASIDAVVDAVTRAKKSVVFCLFAPTDKKLRDAVFAQGDAGKMMFGLINSISEPKPGAKDNAETQAQTAIYHRSRTNKDVYSHDLFAKGGEPTGFWWEVANLPGPAAKFPVYIHHKFVVVDAETDHPVLYTGSANMSGNSLWYNDENLLEIKGHVGLARTYLAEFLRLYEHYRARAQWHAHHTAGAPLNLKKNAVWAKAAYTAGTPEWKSRRAMAGS